jgi:hypothetical protein
MPWKFPQSEDESLMELNELYQRRKADFAKKERGRRYFKAKLEPQKAGDVLNLFFKNDSQALIKIKESQALLAWERYVGKEAAAVSKAVRIKDGELLVWVSDPLWLHQLLLVKRQVIARYHKEFPDLKLRDIFFKRSELPK